MPFNALSGVTGSVKVGATAFAFSKWSCAMKMKLGDVSNFTGGGYEQYVPGLTGAKVTLEGPYDQGNMAFAVGTAFTLLLGFTATITLTVLAVCETIDVDVDIMAPADKVKLGFQSNGSFVAAIT